MSMPNRTLLKVIVLGDSGYVNNSFRHQYKATIGADFLTKELLFDDKLVTLQMWDTAGQERFHSLGAAFYRGADCCILVYDINESKSFVSLKKWHEEFLKQANPSNPETFPFILIGNKVDVDGGHTRVVSDMTAREWCDSRGNIPYHETSAKENTNIDAAFKSVAETILANGNQQDNWGLYEEIPSFCDLQRIPESTADMEQSGGCAC